MPAGGGEGQDQSRLQGSSARPLGVPLGALSCAPAARRLQAVQLRGRRPRASEQLRGPRSVGRAPGTGGPGCPGGAAGQAGGADRAGSAGAGGRRQQPTRADFLRRLAGCSEIIHFKRKETTHLNTGSEEASIKN